MYAAVFSNIKLIYTYKNTLKTYKIEKALNLQWFFFNDVILNVLHTEEQFYYAYFLSLAIEHIMYRTIREADMTM